MGFIWDIIQQSQISEAQERAGSLEERVDALERQLRANTRAMTELVRALERRFGEDLNGDGSIG